MKHSPLPWTFDGPHGVSGSSESRCFLISAKTPEGELTVASVIFNPVQGDDTEQCRADAEMIVRAVNCHNDLLEALTELRDFYVKQYGIPAVKANAAIAKATGGKK